MPRETREIPWLDKRNGVYNVFRYVPPSDEEKAKNPKAKGRTERRGLRTKNAEVAQARYVEILKDATAVFDGPANHAGITVEEALDDYFREHVCARDDKGRPLVVDRRRQENCIHTLKLGFGEGRLLSSIDIPTCRAYAVERRAGSVHGRRFRAGRRTASDATVIREISVLQAAARHALRWKRIKQGEMPTFETPAQDTDGAEAAWLTKADLTKLFELLDARIGDARMIECDDVKVEKIQKFRDWMDLAYAWGARRRSVERLRVEQVFQDTARVNLQKAGERTTKKRRPVVPIFPFIRETIARRVSEAQDGWLFGPRANFYVEFKALCKSAGLEGKDWPHILRHSRASHMLMDGESIYKVGRLLGDTVATVERVYGHHSVEFLESGQENAPLLRASSS